MTFENISGFKILIDPSNVTCNYTLMVNIDRAGVPVGIALQNSTYISSDVLVLV